MQKSFQRLGAESNAQVGREFELAAQAFFLSTGLDLSRNVSVPIGIEFAKKSRAFDLGSLDNKVIVECKSHRWTRSGNVPSAKLSVWNEAMFYFHIAPRDYRKIMFVLRDFSSRRGESLAGYYLRTHGHLIPHDVEFWEYDEENGSAKRLWLGSVDR